MKTISIFLSLLTVALISSCATVVSKYPVGIKKQTLTSKDWNGTWFNKDEIIKIKVKDETNGIIQLSWIEDKEKEFKLESIIVQILKGKQWLYANVLEMENQKIDTDFFWGRIKKEDKQIVFWPPSSEAFKKAAESKKIQARIHKTQTKLNGKKFVQDTGSEKIQLLDKPEKIIDLIENKGSQYFYWEDPLVLIKIAY